jgi:hypothetical protein
MVKKIAIFIGIIAYLFFNKVHAQNISISVTSSNLNINYDTESDFETSRVIQKGISLNVTSTRRGFWVYCRLQPTGNVLLNSLPASPISLKVNSASFNLSSTYYQPRTLGAADVVIAGLGSRLNRFGRIDYDVILNPIGYTVGPGFYDYSFIFTISEQ